ncbi:MAG TPA: gephyrin-like molybdotransferase Glp [Longimicrobiales bacterium]|nr:gephyrin-like molybdotransferase Glp [Longimicrobiales bacterium]
MSDPDLRDADWLPVAEARERILAAVSPLPPAQLPLLDALGLGLAEEITSPVDHPPWDNSAMDGFAVRAEDVRGASPESPVLLEVTQDIPAGAFPSGEIGAGQAARIMTGAPVPSGADSVIRVEHTDAWESEPWARGPQDRIRVLRPDDAGRNIRRRGEDLNQGQPVLRRGTVLRPAEVGVLASVGRTTVRVHRRPRVAILSNGDELVEPEEIAQVEAGRKIVNSNAWSLAASVLVAGGTPVPLGIARDDEDDIRAKLAPALADADLLVTSAGASVGEHDLLKRVLDGLGMELGFWRVQMRPGSPFSFGTVPREEREPLLVFGLPGNPVSALVTYEVLVRPALLRLMGRSRVGPVALRVRAAERIGSKRGLTHFLRVRLERGRDGLWEARLTGPQGSGILTSMAEADALLVVPLERDAVEAGEMVVALPLRSPEEWGEAARYDGG